jgi:hypothetical protein
MMTRPWRECRYKRLSQGKGGETCGGSEKPQCKGFHCLARECQELAQAYSVSTKTVHATLHKDLQLSKKSARWVTKLLYEEMKKEQLSVRSEHGNDRHGFFTI